MADERLRERITDQFSYRGERADVWRGFDLVLDTDAFLNIGYSRWYQPHVVGSSQCRLASKAGATLTREFARSESTRTEPVGTEGGRDGTARDGRPRVLDVGCGRGGPSIHLAEQFGFAVTGVDLVPYNVRAATANARSAATNATSSPAGDATFVVGEASALPIAPNSVDACTAIDALVYVPGRAAVVAELADALRHRGVVVLSDLIKRSDLAPDDEAAVERFAEAWDMPLPGTVEEYRDLVLDAGLEIRRVDDLTANSVGRFRKWTSLYLSLVDSRAKPVVERSLRALDLDPAAVTEQVRRAHDALPSLEHRFFVAQKR